MMDDVESMLMHGREKDTLNIEQLLMGKSYKELTQTIAHIKKNIMKCIEGLENAEEINPSLIYIISNTVNDIELAKHKIERMKNFNF